jgi:hypothetical protein
MLPSGSISSKKQAKAQPDEFIKSRTGGVFAGRISLQVMGMGRYASAVAGIVTDCCYLN